MAKTYRIRRFRNGTNSQNEPFLNYSLTVPSMIGRDLPENLKFTCELTEEGILYRPPSTGGGSAAALLGIRRRQGSRFGTRAALATQSPCSHELG